MSDAAVVDRTKYIQVDLGTIRLETAKSFDLFIRINDDKYVLYLSKDVALTEKELAKLAEKEIKHVYISTDDEDAYEAYLAEHLSDIVADPDVSPDTKSEVVYETSTRVVEDVFREPRTENIQRSKEVIGTTVTMIISDDEAAHRLIQLTSHDYYTYTHSVNVCVFGVALANRLFPKMSNIKIQQFGAGFALHDIGKSQIPLEVLSKNGPLTADEWALMKRHPEFSVDILDRTGHLTDEARAVATQHHERVDGSGYPDRLTGDRIHEFAKICAIADVFDALTTNRSYRTALDSFDALNLMKSEMSDHFHMDYFNEFVRLFAGMATGPHHN